MPYPNQPVVTGLRAPKQPEPANNDSQISNMLNEFEKTKNLNKELLLLRNFGAGKQQQR